MDKLFLEHLDRLRLWLDKNGLAGYEPKDLFGHPLISGFRQAFWELLLPVLSRDSGKRRQSTTLTVLYNKNTQLALRRLFCIKKTVEPKAPGMIAQGYINLFKKTGAREYAGKSKELLEYLIEHRSSGYDNYCWGYTYAWPVLKGLTWPPHTPQSTMTTVIGNAFLDAYLTFGDKTFLEVAESSGEFCLENLKKTEYPSGSVSFSYTPLDDLKIINVNAHVGAFLGRLNDVKSNSRFEEYSRRAMQFLIENQKEDGSWLYHADGRTPNPCDNYHTGDNLEYLYTYLKPKVGNEYLKGLERGANFYFDNFFTAEGAPKMTPYSVFPIDIHSASQAIITLSMLGEMDNKSRILSRKVGEWTVKNMQDTAGFFYFRVYDGDRIDKTPFITWNQAFMFKALTYLL